MIAIDLELSLIVLLLKYLEIELKSEPFRSFSGKYFMSKEELIPSFLFVRFSIRLKKFVFTPLTYLESIS